VEDRTLPRDAAPGANPASRIAVLGLGNVLMGDDALGPWAIRRLQARHEFPPDVSVEDLGTPGLDLVPFVAGHEAVILVDTVSSEGAPGELRLYRRDQILRHPPTPRVTPHDPALKETLLSLEFAGGGPAEVLLVGVIPGRVDMTVGLSEAVRDALPAVEAAVLDELRRLGAPAVAREAPLAPDIWWEAAT
jgi:hydrogenase maturation protease